MKKLLSLLLIISVFIISEDASAVVSYGSTTTYQRSIEYIDDDIFIETIITGSNSDRNTMSTFAANKTITRTKTAHIKSTKGQILWTLSVTGTFTYNGSTSKCTYCTHSTTTGAGWSIVNSTSYKAANYATASATAINKQEKKSSLTVTLQCSKDGVVS